MEWESQEEIRNTDGPRDGCLPPCFLGQLVVAIGFLVLDRGATQKFSRASFESLLNLMCEDPTFRSWSRPKGGWVTQRKVGAA